MRFIKRAVLFILVSVFIVSIFRAPLYRSFLTYKSIGQRPQYKVINQKLINDIEKNLKSNINYGIEEIIKIVLRITSKELKFSKTSKTVNPNNLIESGQTHCIGYSAFYSTVCNYLLIKYQLSDKWTVKHHIGQLYFLDKNIHFYFDNQFFKSHDFVVIENTISKETFAVDPSLNDYLLIDYITFED